jgi:hypothetical protein
LVNMTPQRLLTKGTAEHGQCVLKLMDSVMSEED